MMMIQRNRGAERRQQSLEQTKNDARINGMNHKYPRMIRRVRRRSKSRLPTNLWCSLASISIVLSVCIYFHKGWISFLFSGPSDVENLPASEPSKFDPLIVDELVTDGFFTGLELEAREKLGAMREEFRKEKEAGLLQPCELGVDCYTEGISRTITSFFFREQKSSKIKLHNTLPFRRHVCGREVLGNGGTLTLDEHEIRACHGPPYVHTLHPPSSNPKGVEPMELFWNFADDVRYMDDDFSAKSLETQEFECPVPCRTAGNYELVSVINVKDTKLEILATMEGEKYYGEAKVKPKSHLRDQYYATTSFRSDIPLPYFSWAEYNIQHPAVDFDKVIKGASFLANNCDSDSKREELVLALMQTELRVDSLSGCHNNAQVPEGIDADNKTAIQELYLFHLAFENQQADDYITEKAWGTLASGSLAVYFGAPNVKEHVPERSMIFADDFASPEELADYLIRLTKNKALYESYHAWRYQPIEAKFREKYGFTATHSKCRMCKWAYAKTHGFSWNHSKQEVKETVVPRQTCRNKMGLIGRPFKEYWLSESGKEILSLETDVSIKTCDLNDENRLLKIDNSILQRKVYDTDGVTDMVINHQSAGRRYLLRLETPVQANEVLNVSSDLGTEWRLQDSRSRMTLLTSHPIHVSVVREGTVELKISASIRIRIIVEDVDFFHKGAKKHSSYFGSVMKSDFFSPMEAYKLIQK